MTKLNIMFIAPDWGDRG